MPSEAIAGFLNFLRECKSDYSIALDQEAETNRKTQDILHTLEIENVSYHDGAKLARGLAQVRQERRGCKAAIETLQPIIEWVELNDKVIFGLQKLLGDVRKVESSVQSRTYWQRTDVVAKILKSETRSDGGETDG